MFSLSYVYYIISCNKCISTKQEFYNSILYFGQIFIVVDTIIIWYKNTSFLQLSLGHGDFLLIRGFRGPLHRGTRRWSSGVGGDAGIAHVHGPLIEAQAIFFWFDEPAENGDFHVQLDFDIL